MSILARSYHGTSYEEGISWIFISWTGQVWSTPRQGGLSNMVEAQEMAHWRCNPSWTTKQNSPQRNYIHPAWGVMRFCFLWYHVRYQALYSNPKHWGRVVERTGMWVGERQKKLLPSKGYLPSADSCTKEPPWHKQWELLPSIGNVLWWMLIRQLWGVV